MYSVNTRTRVADNEDVLIPAAHIARNIMKGKKKAQKATKVGNTS